MTVEFEVPDSVTDWNLWVHAVTTDLRGGSVVRQAASVKELMVRPDLPRFLRESDRAVLKVVVNNAGEEAFDGALNLKIYDPDTEEDLRELFGLLPEDASGVPFSVEAGKGTDLSFSLEVPARVGTVAFEVVARAGAFSDGELRPLPVLPGRLHLMQSRFVTLHDADRRELHFADMAADDDPTMIHDQLVVTLDAQLFYSVLNALVLISGTILFVPIGVFTLTGFEAGAVSARGWLSLAYIAIGTSVIAYTIWFWALGRMEATKLSVFNNLQPIITGLLSFWLMGEQIGVRLIVGGVMVIMGVSLTERG